jgi:hypothetical protein
MEQPSPLVSTPSCRAGQVSVARLRSSSASASYLVVVSAEADDAGARGNPRHRGVLSSVEKAGIGLGCWDGGGGGIVDGAAYLPGVMRGWAGAQGDGDVSAGIGLGCWDGGGGGIVDGAAYLPGVMRGWAGAQGDGDVSAGEGRAWWLSPQWMAATTGEGRSTN